MTASASVKQGAKYEHVVVMRESCYQKKPKGYQAERVSMTEAIVDSLIRNQGLVVRILAAVAGMVISYPLLRRYFRHGIGPTQSFDAPGAPDARRYSPGARFYRIALVYVFLGFIAVKSLFGWEPVPRTAGLSLPPIIKGGEKVTPKEGEESVPEDNSRLIIFVHGWRGSDQTWKKFHELAVNDPSLPSDHWIINYPHFMSRRQLDITGLSEWVEEALNTRQVYERYEKIAIIAHSMGGLIARRIAVFATLTRGHPKPIGLLVEIGTPHEGANLAGFSNKIGLRGELTTDMEKDSKFLKLLAKDWSRLGERPGIRPKSQCFYSPQDGVVNQSSAKAGCDTDRPYIEGGHRAIVRPIDRTDYRYEFPMHRVKSYFELL